MESTVPCCDVCGVERNARVRVEEVDRSALKPGVSPWISLACASCLRRLVEPKKAGAAEGE